MKWEYSTAYLGSLAGEPERLEVKGGEGWELVTVTGDGCGVFKRPVESVNSQAPAVLQAPGWYWWREDLGYSWEVVHVHHVESCKSMMRRMSERRDWLLEDSGGEWGPKIDEPEGD